MSVHAGIKNAAELAAPVESYDRFVKAAHWSTLLLIAAAYGVAWMSHAVATKEQHAIFVELHRSLGVTIFALTVFRLAWRWHARIPSLPADLPAIQKVAARVTEYGLYVLMLAQPILGVLHTNAQGRRIDFYFLRELPTIVGPDKVLAKQAIALHDLVAYVLLAIIALHAVAALFHHFVRRDNVLKAMLPGHPR
ncbi:MAG: cytochrome b [Acetobacteraceae bacterium]|nr:cytochrome b [Acetobacteraceae bacterium]